MRLKYKDLDTSRNACRDEFKERGFTTKHINHETMLILKTFCEAYIKDSATRYGSGDYTVKTLQTSGDAQHRDFLIRCEYEYFNDREWISCYHDGFIGFAGWADDNNIKPALRAFMHWLDELDSITDELGNFVYDEKRPS